MFIAGRIEFLGKHTDYCGGQSIVCAIDKGFKVDFQPNQDNLIEIEKADSGEVISFPFNKNLAVEKNHWKKYPQTVAKRIARNFQSKTLRGVKIKFSSNLPPAAGLSSSSALIIAAFFALAKTNDLENFAEYQENIGSKFELAEYLGCVENGRNYKNLTGDKGVGTFGGSEDHAAILCGRKNFLSRFSFSPVELKKEIAFPKDWCFVIASSGVAAEKTGAAKEKYNRCSLLAKEIAGIFGEDSSLAVIIEKYGFAAVRSRFGNQDLIDRLTQFYVENFEIIPQVSSLLEKGEIERIGELIDLSHQNADKFLRNQIPETNVLQASAREVGAAASSAFGAGFGGSVYALVKKIEAEKFLSEWKKEYLKKFPLLAEIAEFFITEPGESEI